MSLRTPLSDLHLASGAVAWTLDGFTVQGDYGSPEAEVGVLKRGCGLVDRSWIGRLEVCGEDRHRFLNGLTSGEVKSLEPGTSRYTFFTDGKGRVLADARVLALEDRIWLELPAGRSEAVRDHLSMYIVADRVEVFGLKDVLPLTIAGPGSSRLLGEIGVDLPEPGTHGRVKVLGTEVHLERAHRDGSEWSTLWVSSGIAAEVWEEILVAGRPMGLAPVGLRALEALRIEAGVGRWGHDFDGENLPQETGRLQSAVDFDKGCYLGQEIVARLHYRGRPKRLLVAVELGGQAPEDGTPVHSGETVVGRITSSTWSTDLSMRVGLASVEREALERDGELLVDGFPISLRELPAS